MYLFIQLFHRYTCLRLRGYGEQDSTTREAILCNND